MTAFFFFFLFFLLLFFSILFNGDMFLKLFCANIRSLSELYKPIILSSCDAISKLFRELYPDLILTFAGNTVSVCYCSNISVRFSVFFPFLWRFRAGTALCCTAACCLIYRSRDRMTVKAFLAAAYGSLEFFICNINTNHVLAKMFLS